MGKHPEIFLEAHNLQNMYTGFGQFNYHLISNLITQDSNFDFIINTRKKRILEAFGKKIKFHQYTNLSRYKPFRVKGDFNVWHSLNQNTKVEPLKNIPYVLTIHDVIFKEEEIEPDKKKTKRLQEKIDRSDRLVFISEYSKKKTNEFFSIPSSTTQQVIYNGNPIKKPKGNIIQQPNFNLKKPFLFSIGQFMKKKNFHSLLEMLKHLNNYQLIIAGNHNTQYGEEIQATVRKLNLENRVILPGKISENTKHYLFQECEAFVFPSLFEGFGLPPIEAMAYGKPVFLANRTSLPEIGGKFAFYWNEFDGESMAGIFKLEMEKFENNKNNWSANLKERASFFNWDTTAKQYIKVYNSLL